MSDRALPDEAEAYLSLLARRGRAANTVAAYGRDLAAYCEFLARRGQRPATADGAAVQSYVARLEAAGRAPSSVARAVVSIRALHRFLLETGQAADDAAGEVPAARVPAGLSEPVREDEVALLLAVVGADGPCARRDRSIIELLYRTGLRVSELVGLELDDVDLRAGTVTVPGRVVPLTTAVAALAAWLGPGGRPALVRRADPGTVFVNARGGRLSRQGAWTIVRRHGDRAGLGDRLRPELLRQSRAAHLLDGGADVREVQELLGHASIGTTQRLRRARQALRPRT